MPARIHENCVDFRVITWDKGEYLRLSVRVLLMRVGNEKWLREDVRPGDFYDGEIPALWSESHVIVV